LKEVRPVDPERADSNPDLARARIRGGDFTDLEDLRSAGLRDDYRAHRLPCRPTTRFTTEYAEDTEFVVVVNSKTN
jgi:hypothetical protein